MDAANQVQELQALVDSLMFERELLVQGMQQAGPSSANDSVVYPGLNIQWVLSRLEEHYRCALYVAYLLLPHCTAKGLSPSCHETL